MIQICVQQQHIQYKDQYTVHIRIATHTVSCSVVRAMSCIYNCVSICLSVCLAVCLHYIKGPSSG